jgi:hypothetical protein
MYLTMYVHKQQRVLYNKCDKEIAAAACIDWLKYDSMYIHSAQVCILIQP